MSPHISFPGLEPEETIVLALRKHWSVAVGFIVRYVALGFLPVIVFVLLSNFTDVLANRSAFLSFLLTLADSLYYLFLILFFFRAWIDYYLDVWVVTDKRIVNIEQRGLFSRTVSEVQFARVQDVTSEVNGILATFLKFGNLYVQTAGETERFAFEHVSQPEKVAKLIFDLHERWIREHGSGEPNEPPAKPTPPATQQK